MGIVYSFPITLGNDIKDNPFTVNLSETGSFLLQGSSGCGKTTQIKCILSDLFDTGDIKTLDIIINSLYGDYNSYFKSNDVVSTYAYGIDGFLLNFYDLLSSIEFRNNLLYKSGSSDWKSFLLSLDSIDFYYDYAWITYVIDDLDSTLSKLKSVLSSIEYDFIVLELGKLLSDSTRLGITCIFSSHSGFDYFDFSSLSEKITVLDFNNTYSLSENNIKSDCVGEFFLNPDIENLFLRRIL